MKRRNNDRENKEQRERRNNRMSKKKPTKAVSHKETKERRKEWFVNTWTLRGIRGRLSHRKKMRKRLCTKTNVIEKYDEKHGTGELIKPKN